MRECQGNIVVPKEERVLPGVRVISLAAAFPQEAEARIKRLRAKVGFAHLKRHHGCAEQARCAHHAEHQPPAESAPAERRVHSNVCDVCFIKQNPHARVCNYAAIAFAHEIMGNVILQLSRKRGAGPGRAEADALKLRNALHIAFLHRAEQHMLRLLQFMHTILFFSL